MQIDPVNPPPGAFLYRTETHYDQLDGQMLLHHPRYLVLVERAQQSWFEEVLSAPRFDWQNFPDMYVVVRKLELDYVSSIDGVRDILVLLWPGKIRAASQRTNFAFYSADGQHLHAYGYRLNCKVDPHSHEPRIWSDAFRSEMEKRGDLASAIKVP
jgi:acyl-CoA thioesterase FadM